MSQQEPRRLPSPESHDRAAWVAMAVLAALAAGVLVWATTLNVG